MFTSLSFFRGFFEGKTYHIFNKFSLNKFFRLIFLSILHKVCFSVDFKRAGQVLTEKMNARSWPGKKNCWYQQKNIACVGVKIS